MAFGAAEVKALREQTGAGMMDCKKALVETDGDIEAAVDWLRTKGLAAAAKKAGRVTAEGLVALSAAGNKGALVELNAETDFVARNDQFQALVGQMADAAIENGSSLDALNAASLPDGKSISQSIVDAISTIGENMSLRRAAQLSVSEGVVASYMHNATAPNLSLIHISEPTRPY